MPKKKAAKPTAKAAKKAKLLKKTEKKEQKTVKKSKKDEQEDDDQDLEGILEKMQREWEESHAVTEETVEGPPSRRANATFTPCPNGNHLWCIGGEYFSEDGKAHFYNDVYRYAPDKDEWRRFASPTCPGPRSAHAVVGVPFAGGKLFLFGGEFSSLYQNSFHHYRDFWSFDISTHSWDRIETKVRPTARSGHRMGAWKHLIILFGGFYDPGIRTNYLQDLWIFDTQTYKWQQVEFKDADRKPSPRSGFSFLSVPEGVILHGGYCKVYVKGKRAQGVALEDTWLLKMDADLKLIKWERRKKGGYPPSVRSGCTMAFWANRSMGVLFGGVYDNDRDEETMDSVFFNDMFAFQTAGNGRWISLMLKRPKKKAGAGKKAKPPAQPPKPQQRIRHEGGEGQDEAQSDEDDYDDDREEVAPVASPVVPNEDDDDPDDPEKTRPLARYNAMLAILRNTLYIYGGIYESGSREYTLDDFYALQLDKLDRFICLRPSSVIFGADESSSSDSDSDGDSDDSDDSGDDEDRESETEDGDAPPVAADLPAVEKEEPVESEVDLRARATAFMGVSTDGTRSPEDVISTPLPGESLAAFYARSRTYWAQKALTTTDNRGKQLRRDGFQMAEERYTAYKPLLLEIEKILAEAGLDEEEIKRSAAGGAAGNAGQSRNRR